VLQDAAVKQKIPALLPPYTATLAAWASSFAGPDKRRLSDTAREILLLELLHQYPKWRREYGDWPLADSLLALMDELTRHNCLPEQIATTLHRTTPNDSSLISGTYSPLSDEAQLVQTIFTEWLERMESEKLQDLSMQYLEGLNLDPKTSRTPKINLTDSRHRRSGIRSPVVHFSEYASKRKRTGKSRCTLCNVIGPYLRIGRGLSSRSS